LIERFFRPAGPRKSLKSWFLHLRIYLFFTFLGGIAGALGTIAAVALARYLGFNLGLIDLRFAGGKGLLALLGALWVSLAAHDFFFYWYHRTMHKVPFLWQIHKMHHMDPELDSLTLGRGNWGEAFIVTALTTMPLAIVFKIDALDLWSLGLMSGIIVTVLGTFLQLGHVNVRLQVGKASLIYCSPQVHRIHHSRLSQHQDKNFAFIFPLWDALFGTYYAPARDEFPPTGVDGEKEIQSLWESQIVGLREWLKMLRVWRGGPAPR